MTLLAPFGLLLALIVLELAATIGPGPKGRGSPNLLVWLYALAMVFAALTGLGARASEASDSATAAHGVIGGLASALALMLAIIHRASRGGTRRAMVTAYHGLLALSFFAMLATLHYGAFAAHGTTASSSRRERERSRDHSVEGVAQSDEPRSSYASHIAPLLERRCTSCHGGARQRGGLALHDVAGFLSGGESGASLFRTATRESELWRRVTLDQDDHERMPLPPKPALGAQELAIVDAWLAAGAPFEGTIETIEAAARALASSAEVTADSEIGSPVVLPAPEAAIARLRQRGAHVATLDEDSPLLIIDFAAVSLTLADEEATLRDLEPLCGHAAVLSCARAPITDAFLPLFARMPSLERLDLRDTRVTATGLEVLRDHEHLRVLNLAQTAVDDSAIETLLALPALVRVYLWKTPITARGLERLQRERPALVVDVGEGHPDTLLESEPPPRFSSEAGSDDTTLAGRAPSALAGSPSKPPAHGHGLCPVSGKSADPQFTIIHEGRVIGFCCSDCAVRFWAEPSSFGR